MKMTLVLGAVIGLGAAWTPGRGSAAPVPTPSTCEDTAITQGELTACAHEKASAADRRLNAAYRDLLRYVDGEEKRKLVAAQRTWLLFRDADCALFGHGDGSKTPMHEANLIAEPRDQACREISAR